AWWAPVNAPRSKPKSSDSMSVSGMAAQLTATKGRAARGPWRCRRLATSPLPAPVSPDSSTAGNRPVAAVPRRSRRMLARRVSMAGLAPSNTSGALIRAASYLSLRVGHPARAGAEDAAGALRRRHELARHDQLHGADRVEAEAGHGHAAVAQRAQPIVGQGRTQEVAAHLLPTRPVVGPQPTRWRAGRSPGCAPGVAPGHRARRSAGRRTRAQARIYPALPRDARHGTG